MKNELSSKEATTGESVLRKKVIREEMVPYWLENGNIHQQEEKKPPILEKERDARFHELMERVKNLSRGESFLVDRFCDNKRNRALSVIRIFVSQNKPRQNICIYCSPFIPEFDTIIVIHSM